MRGNFERNRRKFFSNSKNVDTLATMTTALKPRTLCLVSSNTVPCHQQARAGVIEPD
jgi:hypothetical protein